jgi:hypothetical protein
MAQPTNTFDRYDLATKGDNAREDFSNIIYNLSPTETVFMSNAGRGTATNTLTEWLIDELAAPDLANKQIDGNDFSGGVITDAARIGNYCQISWKDLVVSRRANKINKAGRKSEMAYAIAKKGKELKRDMEAILTGAKQIAAPGNSTTAGTTADLTSWLKTNTNRGAGGADPVLSNTTYGQPTTACVDGTIRALSEATMLGVLADCYNEGGNPGAVDVYVSDFGVLDVVPNRRQRTTDVFVLDMEYWSVNFFDSFKTEVIAKSGDSEKRRILADYALCSKNEAASGVIADVNSATAMVA